MKSVQPKFIILALALLVLGVSHGVQAKKGTSLKQTLLFTKLAHGCRDVDPPTWKSPVQNALAGDGIVLDKLLLCSDDKYPVMYIRFPFDPNQHSNDSYFHPLSARLAEANGYRPYSFISLMDKTVVNVTPAKGSKTDVKLSYETFK